ncbi:MAG: N-acetylmuramoyl-L-alanine amidase [Candidatus Dependentiae bacterium]
MSITKFILLVRRSFSIDVSTALAVYRRIILLTLFIVITTFPARKKKITLILDPAGDARNPGRLIGDNYERTYTSRIAHQLKEILEKKDNNIMVLFTRLPGEQNDQREKTRFANRCAPHLFINLCAYQSTHIKPQIYMYYYTNQTTTDNNCLIPLENAYQSHSALTTIYANKIYTSISPCTRICDAHAPKGIACIPLKGINAPALCIEIGCNSAHNLHNTISLISDALYTCLEEQK